MSRNRRLAPTSRSAVEFGLALREARIRAGMTQIGLGNALATGQSYLSRLEGGLVNPTLAICEEFAAAVGCVYVSELRSAPQEK